MTDFKNISRVKIYRTYDGWDDLSIEAQAVFLIASMSFDHNGVPRKGALYTAAIQLFAHSTGTPILELVEAGFLEATGFGYRCPWWKESQTAPKSNALRQREFKERK